MENTDTSRDGSGLAWFWSDEQSARLPPESDGLQNLSRAQPPGAAALKNIAEHGTKALNW